MSVEAKKKGVKNSWKVRSRKAVRISLAVKDAASAWLGGDEPVFLNLARVLSIHADQMTRYGGSDGVRDMALLQSALAQPEASFSGAWLHEDLFDMAAAYAFHICQNHPFFDGNKRTALVSALVFLEMNGGSFLNPREIFIETMLAVAAGKTDKKELSRIFRTLPRE